MLSRDPVLHELNRQLVAERGAATPVVEHFVVVDQIGNSLGTGSVAGAMHPFVLQGY